mmetsp:Transcript_2305/g.2829  ORF Transcript_2305/g.2829 Transcript_2305/m.2829 type:complete len:85 (+) Transcript_2305:487-741(+)
MPNYKEVGEALDRSAQAKQHRQEEKDNQKTRQKHEEKALDEDATLFDRTKALGNAVMHGAKEVTEGCQREYQSHKASSAVNNNE